VNGPDVLLPGPVQAAPLPEVRNHTPYPSQYYQMVDVGDEVFHVIACRSTYDLNRLDAQGAPQAAAEQAPLVLADQFHGQVNRSSCIQESDLAPFKPRCDVLLIHAVAHAPKAQPHKRWPVGMRIGAWEKILSVTGPRLLERRAMGWRLTEPEPALQVPLRWEHAFGGSCRWPLAPLEGQEPELQTHYEANPIGCGWVDPEWLKKSRVADVDAPQLERWRQPFDQAAAQRMDYRPEGVGVVGRWWTPRREKAGTYDAQWKESRWPRLPLDFDFGYWNAAPEDQQIDYPQGGEEVHLAGLRPGGGLMRFVLPTRLPFTRVRLHAGPILPRAMKLDTLVIDPQAMTLSCVHRMTLAARAHVRVLEIVQ
jgi:hypothetical protein